MVALLNLLAQADTSTYEIKLSDTAIAWIAPAVAPVLSLLVALVTKEVANPRLKALALQFLATLTAVLATLAANDWTFEVKATLVTLIATYLTSEVFYSLVWKRYGLAALVAAWAPNFGLVKGPLTSDFAPPIEVGTVTITTAPEVADWINSASNRVREVEVKSEGPAPATVAGPAPASQGPAEDHEIDPDTKSWVEGAPDEDWTDPPTGTPGT